jgi:hypothetical protein
MDHLHLVSKLKNVWSYTRVFMVWTRTLTFSPVRIFKTEYRLFWLKFSWLSSVPKGNNTDHISITQDRFLADANSSSSIHLTIDATENETTRLSYSKPKKEPECTLHTNCTRKCYPVIHRCSLHVRYTQRPTKCIFSDDVHICCIAICYKLHDSMRDSRFPKVMLIKTKVLRAMNPISANSSGRFRRSAAYICWAI